jgi:acetyltransferase-like isoleucine patch superfamily enzyme
VLPGVTIPDGVVVGAMSLVLEDTELEPWGVYAGCPVRKLRDRPRERILKLEEELERHHPAVPDS